MISQILLLQVWIDKQLLWGKLQAFLAGWRWSEEIFLINSRPLWLESLYRIGWDKFGMLKKVNWKSPVLCLKWWRPSFSYRCHSEKGPSNFFVSPGFFPWKGTTVSNPCAPLTAAISFNDDDTMLAGLLTVRRTHLAVRLLSLCTDLWCVAQRRDSAQEGRMQDHEEVPILNLRQTIPTSGLERQITFGVNGFRNWNQCHIHRVY